jgi:Asp-tRNA(Asn)/Glu-tRNA(Gln) amidotransferase C subunit
MSFSVEKVAELAYLKLSPSEREAFAKQFKDILGYVDQLQKVSMTASEAKSMGAFHIQTAFYEELKLEPSLALRNGSDQGQEVEGLVLSNEEATKNAPKSSGLPGQQLFEVPSIIER